ncbi:hypothetical protein IL306_007063, partial [Fusarium sp. DS 682]
MKWFPKALIILASAAFISQGHPTAELAEINQHEERANVQLIGNKVAVVTGVVLNSELLDCFGNNGLEMAKGWAGALYDQWFYSRIQGTVKSIEALVSTKHLTSQYCFTVDAVFDFASKADAQKFATFIQQKVGNAKRDESTANGIDGAALDVYIEGIDLPYGHAYFGSNTSKTETSSLSG